MAETGNEITLDGSYWWPVSSGCGGLISTFPRDLRLLPYPDTWDPETLFLTLTRSFSRAESKAWIHWAMPAYTHSEMQ